MFFLTNSRKLTRPVPGRSFFTSLGHGPAMRLMARGVLVAWMAPLLWGALALGSLNATALPAEAQAAVQTAVVLDFAVEPGLDPGLGRKAADALAVELQRSGNFDVRSRQEVEQVVATQPGLRPPYNQQTQARLGQLLGARSVFSGRVARLTTVDRQSVRIQVEVRQLDVATADYINGAQVAEVTTDKLEAVDNDVLLDEAINKAAFSSVRSLRETLLPEGTVLNVTRQDVELNLGVRNGVAPGQRYSVLREVFSRARNVVERIKVGEVQILRVEADSSVARVTGGLAGVRTGDKVRQIFEPTAVFPVSPQGGSSAASIPPPASKRTPSVVKKAGNAAIGLVALGLLVALAGFGGGSSGSRADVTPPRDVVAIPTTSGGNPAISVNFSRGLPGLLGGTNIVGYFIYRDTTRNFAATPTNLHDFIRGNQTSYLDTSNPAITRSVDISATSTGGGGGGGGGTPTQDITIDETTSTTAVSGSLQQTSTDIDADFTRTPLVSGTQYFYRVRRITAVRVQDPNNAAQTRLNLAISDVSPSSGGATAIPLPTVVSTSNNLDNFTVTIQAGLNPPTVPPVATGNPFGEVDQFTVEVSAASTFPTATTFVRINPPRSFDPATGQITFTIGDIRVEGFDPGDPDRQVFVRVCARNTTDSPGATICGRPFAVVAPSGSLVGGSSRFLRNDGTGRSIGGVGLPGRPGSRTRSGGRRTPPQILRPR